MEAESGGYFTALADYIHLNPARARLLAGKEALGSYRWSSLPYYVGRARQRPSWLEVSRVLGELGLEDRAKDRRAYGERMEERAREGVEDEEQLREMRRGWVLGGEGFRDRVLDWIEGVEGVSPFFLPLGGEECRPEEWRGKCGSSSEGRFIT